MIRKVNGKLHFSPTVKTYCQIPYHNHPNGCPNWNHKKGCPPDTPMINDVLDFNREIYIICTEFALYEHIEKMEVKHPNWTIWQLKCCLYWQPKARKEHELELKHLLLSGYSFDTIIRCPEAYGVHLFDTMRELGIPLEQNPTNITRIISLGGWKK